MYMQEEKKGIKGGKVKKGWLAVEVGLEAEADEDGGEGFERFVIPIAYLYHPLFKRLLDKAHDVYGYHTTGPLRLPCSAHDFLNLKRRIDKDKDYSTSTSTYSASSNHHHHHATPTTTTSTSHHHHLPLTFSFHFP